MRLFLTPEATAVTTPGGLSHLPRYSPQDLFVTVSDFSGARDRELAYASTKGSQDWLWSGDDEFRFKESTGGLDSLFLYVPEDPPERTESHERWVHTPPVEVGLAMTPPQDFTLNRTVTRWISASGTHLVCCNEANGNDGDEQLDRLRVAEGFDLLFLRKVLAGWMLESPERFLANGWETSPRTNQDPGLAQFLRDYLTVVSLPRLELLDDGDQEVLADLRSLERRALAAATTDPRYGIMGKAVERLLTDTRS